MQKNQGILLGVVGTDIPLPELMKLIPKHMVQSAVLMCINNYINLVFFNSFLAYLVSLARNPRLHLCHHQQWLHPDAPRSPTFGKPVFSLFKPEQSVNNPSLHPVIFLSFSVDDDVNASVNECTKTQMCGSKAERIVSNPHLFL